MERRCDNCRYYHALFVYDGGTCHRKPPRLIGAEALQDLEDAPDADVVEMKRWPAVLRSDLCAQHEFRCQYGSCREQPRITCLRDVIEGNLYCERHWYHRRQDTNAA